MRAKGKSQPLAIRAVQLNDADGKIESILVVVKIAVARRLIHASAA